MRLFPAVAAALALVTPSVSAQIVQVVINEVNFTKGAQWIELYNATTADVKLGTWSIYHATKTANRAGDYWWGFPSATEIKAGDYLRIHWGAVITTSSDKRNIYTGHTNWHFLFGHGFEALDPAQGAIAICTTKDNKQVNAANIFSDWWQWGSTGFKRESLAVSNIPTSLWNANSFAPVVPAGSSLMRLASVDKLPHPLAAFRFDTSPTPLADNTEGMKVELQGTSCNWNKPDGTVISADPLAYHGNADWSITVDKTKGPAFFEGMFITVRLDNTTQNWANCTNVLGWTGVFVATPMLSTSLGSTTIKVPLTLSGTNGVTAYFQSLIFGRIGNNYYSFSNHLKVTLSK